MMPHIEDAHEEVAAMRSGFQIRVHLIPTSLYCDEPVYHEILVQPKDTVLAIKRKVAMTNFSTYVKDEPTCYQDAVFLFNHANWENERTLDGLGLKEGDIVEFDWAVSSFEEEKRIRREQRPPSD